ncbi:MAG: hypothetical protein Q9167_008089, partial [Letrouitia subvulpina]
MFLTFLFFGCFTESLYKNPDITLITPPSSSIAIEAAISRNPHLTSLPLPRADIIAPKSLSQNTGTAELLRLPEVQAVIDRDFLILPCDIVSELSGESLLESWMTQAANVIGSRSLGGGLGVWFDTRGEHAVKGEETDFVITTQLPKPIVPPPETSLRPYLSKLLYSTTTDTLRDIMDEKKIFPIRRSLIRKHGRIRLLTTHRAAHIYLFPRWILDFVNRNPKLDSISEDV